MFCFDQSACAVQVPLQIGCQANLVATIIISSYNRAPPTYKPTPPTYNSAPRANDSASLAYSNAPEAYNNVPLAHKQALLDTYFSHY